MFRSIVDNCAIDELLNKRGAMKGKCFIECDFVTNRDDMERAWRCTSYNSAQGTSRFAHVDP